MSTVLQHLTAIVQADVIKMIISKPKNKSQENKKVVIEQKENCYQISTYTEKQVFHENISVETLAKKCEEIMAEQFMQINAWSAGTEHMLMISKKGSCTYKKKAAETVALVTNTHNRKKQYILEEGCVIEPLIDMGIFTKEGAVVRSMYDKYRQINRFIEILDDEISKSKKDTLNIIDFGCGKSYLTFIVYYYLTEIKKMKANVIGLDLKADVIEKCNIAAKKYGYDGLVFELGDINGFKAPFDVDMVITLHACDTATDYALYNAVQWNAKLIFSVPCCQHELNEQICTENLAIMTRYGILKERFCAIATDAMRGNLLEYCGYKTQLLEFVDLSHTPKNILIRAVKKPNISKQTKEKALAEVEALKTEFAFEPTLYKLLVK